MPFSPTAPFNELPPLPPKAELETRVVLKLCIEARAELAELKQLGESLPNPTVLINAIPLLEAQASSEIENIVTTTSVSGSRSTLIATIPVYVWRTFQ